jgi:hypothetical protein
LLIYDKIYPSWIKGILVVKVKEGRKKERERRKKKGQGLLMGSHAEWACVTESDHVRRRDSGHVADSVPR